MQDLSSECLSVTLDITALYTNIPHQQGMEVCREELNTRDALDPPTDDVVHIHVYVHLIALILKKKNFSFNGENYLQKHGTVMGTRMAPSFANIFIGRLEKNLLYRTTYKPII